MLQCQQHLFQVFCVIANSLRSQSTSIFVHVKSNPVCYDVIYHPFPITPKNLKIWVVDSLHYKHSREMIGDLHDFSLV